MWPKSVQVRVLSFPQNIISQISENSVKRTAGMGPVSLGVAS